MFSRSTAVDRDLDRLFTTLLWMTLSVDTRIYKYGEQPRNQDAERVKKLKHFLGNFLRGHADHNIEVNRK